MTTLVADTFTRADNSVWGTASDGNTWAHPSGNATLAIASNEGTVTQAAVSPSNVNIMVLGSATTADMEVLVRCSLGGASGCTMGLILRYLDVNNYVRLNFNTGAFSMQAFKNGSATTVGSDFTHVSDTSSFWWIRAQVIGTTTKARNWKDGNTEGSTWMITGNFNSGTGPIAAGKAGIYANTANTTPLKYDNFQATIIVTASGSTSNLLRMHRALGRIA